jgi:hypothetical protein
MFRSRLRRPQAPKLAIRTERPLSWRIGIAATAIVALVTALAVAYDQGRRRGGYLHDESQQQIETLRVQNQEMRAALDETKKLADSSSSRLQVEQTAQERLAGMIRHLEDENGRLKAELAVFEGLASNQAAKPTLAISRVDVQPNGAGHYRYRMMVARSTSERSQEFKGQLQMDLTVQRGDRTIMIKMPDGGDASPYQLAFRFFKRIEGDLQVQPNDRIVAIEFRILEDGKLRATQTFRPAT